MRRNDRSKNNGNADVRTSTVMKFMTGLERCGSFDVFVAVLLHKREIMSFGLTVFASANPITPQAFASATHEMQITATVLFGLAVVHTFLVKQLGAFSHRFRPGSIGKNLFHFLGEVEIIFGFWAFVLMITWSFRFGTDSMAAYLESVNFTEAAFVFVIMCMAATRPIMEFARRNVLRMANVLPFSSGVSFFCTLLTVGPLLGSLITEPAAMTVTALLLREAMGTSAVSTRLKYVTVGLLFVNVSIGGTLTHFAAPPVVMVARPWGWDLTFLFSNFGWKAAISVIVGTVATALVFRKELGVLSLDSSQSDSKPPAPLWTALLHGGFIGMTVLYSHHMSFFIPLFLLFLGWAAISEEYQDEIRIRQSLLVGFFLGGLVTLGHLQAWWLQPVLEGMDNKTLFWGAAALTAFTDNAALTYLGTLVPTLHEGAKYALVAGAVTGGGLTVIANAPNPAGYSILSPIFGEDGINPLGLALAALPFTLLAALAFLVL